MISSKDWDSQNAHPPTFTRSSGQKEGKCCASTNQYDKRCGQSGVIVGSSRWHACIIFASGQFRVQASAIGHLNAQRLFMHAI